MNCLLTGGAGIVGSHIIFEWLHKAIVEKTVQHLFVVIRDSKKSANERLLAILQDPSRPDFLNDFTLEACLEKITVLPYDLVSMTKTDLEKHNFTTVIHCAGSTNLQNTADSKEKVHTQNYLVTKQILAQLPTKVTRFIYISTAYSFGIQNEKVDDCIENYSVTKFRNPYEQSKYESELYVKQTCQLKNIDAQILRPSIICGRLIDAPFYETPKFDVFYSWPIFLNKYANKTIKNFRIWVDKNSGLNIVPVDFVAKAILHAYLNSAIKELNIVNPQQLLHTNYVGAVLASFNINSFEYVSKKPTNLNAFEELYYKTIGAIFENYISVPDLQYKTDQIHKLIEKLQLKNTLGVHENFMNLINFSVEKEFRNSYL